MRPLSFLRALFSAVFPPKRRIVRLIRPPWHTTDLMLLECGHRVAVWDYSVAAQPTTRCDRCVR